MRAAKTLFFRPLGQTLPVYILFTHKRKAESWKKAHQGLEGLIHLCWKFILPHAPGAGTWGNNNSPTPAHFAAGARIIAPDEWKAALIRPARPNLRLTFNFGPRACQRVAAPSILRAFTPRTSYACELLLFMELLIKSLSRCSSSAERCIIKIW